MESASIAVSVGDRQVEPLVFGLVIDRQAADRRAADRQVADRQAADEQPATSEVRLASQHLMPSLASLLYDQLLLCQILPWLPFFLVLYLLQYCCPGIPNNTGGLL